MFSRILKEGPLNGDLANGETNTATGSVSSSSQTARSESGDLSYIGRVNYAYDGRYLFEFLIRISLTPQPSCRIILSQNTE